jgi:transposase
VICLDEMGPESAKSFPGPRLVRSNPNGERRGRARQEIDYGRRGGGYVFGAFVPVTGAALTASYPRRTTANVVAFLQRVEGWLDPSIDRVYVVLDNLAAHRAPDVLLWALVHPRWEFVFQPRYAAYLNLIEPWWKVLRSLALTGRRFETWEQLCAAVDRATQYWNAHRHPFVWGRRKRRRSARPSGIARLPIAAQTSRMDHLGRVRRPSGWVRLAGWG